MTVYKQGPGGQTIIDWHETGRESIRAMGHDPDAELNIEWDRVPDRRLTRSPEEVGIEFLAQRAIERRANGHVVSG